MRLGIDFGTTHIVVAAVDRGNYPIVSFEGPSGHACEWFPSLVALRGTNFLYGWKAWEAQTDKSSTVIRSIKRYLQEGGPETLVEIEGRRFPMMDLLSALTSELRRALVEDSSLNLTKTETLQVMVGVPAHANANQRFLTVEAFRRSDFDVMGVLNEPSAATIEFSHASRNHKPESNHRILVYDLGGGTFDVSFVEVNGQDHEVIASDGISRLGGDDFDDVLAELVLEKAGFNSLEYERFPSADLYRLYDECRRQKEAITLRTRDIVIDLDAIVPGWTSVSIPVEEFYGRCEALIGKTMATVESLLTENRAAPDVVYMTGGGSELPPVANALRAAFGDRVRRSGYTRAATALGLAIQADAASGYWLTDKLTRHFGVWREAEGGRRIAFDPLFRKGIELPHPGHAPIQVKRRYRPVHNIGHFRFLECSRVTDDGRPAGEITFWDEIRFPFDPIVRADSQYSGISICRSENAGRQEIEETYSCDSAGSVSVHISNVHAGYDCKYQLGRWTARNPAIPLGRRWQRGAASAGS